MKETVVDYEVETVEVERDVYRSDLTGAVIDDDEVVMLGIVSDPSETLHDQLADRMKELFQNRCGSKRIYEQQKGYQKAVADLDEILNEEGQFIRVEDSSHCSSSEYADLVGIDEESIDVNTSLPKEYVQTDTPEEKSGFWDLIKRAIIYLITGLIGIAISIWGYGGHPTYIVSIIFLLCLSCISLVGAGFFAGIANERINEEDYE